MKYDNSKRLTELAIAKLAVEFHDLDLTFHQMADGKPGDVTSYWPGPENEDVLVCVFKGTQIEEPFHRQDFFFLNYAYRNSYQALSARYDNLITIREDECYISQPYGGYALRCDSVEESVIIGVLVRRNVFYREYLSLVSSSSDLFRFFVEPQSHRLSEEHLLLSMTKDHAVRRLLEMMVEEYADRKEDSQPILKALLQSILLHIARRYRLSSLKAQPHTVMEEMIQYIGDHSDSVTLQELSEHFSYHPVYISAQLPKETGKTFSQILLEKRMERALPLLKNTTLSIEEIADMLGYSNSSNFYKAFKKFYGSAPREYMDSL